jgi:hypothetical protein
MKRYDATPILTVVMMTLSAVVGYGQTQRTSVSVAEVTGTFRMNLQSKVRGSNDEIKIASTGKGKLHVFMDLTYPYKMQNGEDMANTGQLDGEFAIEGDVASYTSEDKQCTITIRFLQPGKIAVNQAGSDAECGFGHNVNALGNYKKISSAKPKFDQQ